jgi:hypothetical protein
LKKRQLLFLTFLVFLTQALCAQVKDKPLPLKEVLAQIETRHNVKFSFIDSDVAPLELIPPPERIFLEQKLDYIQEKTGLFFKVSGTYITLYKSLTDKFLCGYVVDDLGTPLENVTVLCPASREEVVTDARGYYEFSMPATGAIVFKHVGYQPGREAAEKLKGDCNTITLNLEVTVMEEVVTEVYLTSGISKSSDGSFLIKPRRFGILPGLIEPDVLQTMQQLPGVNSIDETISNINVRGGTHDQNLFMWNGIRLFQTGHFFGLISALNPNLANEIKIFKNGTSAFYGESVSSAVDISSRSERIVESNTIVGSNMINGEFYTKVKASERANFEVSARRSFTDVLDFPTYSNYSDRIFQNTVVTQLSNSNDVNYKSDKEFYFFDFTAQYHQQFSDMHNLYVDVIGIDNNLDFTEGTVTETNVVTRYNNLRQQTFGGSVSLKSQWDKTTTTNINFYRSLYDVNAKNEAIESSEVVFQKNKIRDMGMSIAGTNKLSKRFTLHGGYQYNMMSIENFDAVNTPYFPRNTNEAINTQALIGELEFNSKNGKLYARPGLRINYIDEPATIYAEPRLQVNYKLSGSFSVEILGERKSQTVSQVVELQDDFLGIEKRRWVIANDKNNIPIQKSIQASAGLTYKKKGWLVSVDNFYKKVDGITTTGQAFQNQLENIASTGNYTVTGSEVLIQKQFRSIYAWMSYTFNNNNYEFENLDNIPAVFPSNFEINHTVNSAVIYDWKDLKIALGSKWFTGRPVTTPLYSVPELSADQTPQIVYSAPNSDNLDSFFQINFSASHQWNFGEHVKFQLGVSVLNIFNKLNIINRYYRINPETSAIEVVNTYSITRTPNVTLKFFIR